MSIHNKFLKKLTLLLTVILIFPIFTGCENRLAQQKKYKDLGIEAMSSGDFETAVSDFQEALNYAPKKVTKEEIDICYYKAAAQYLTNDFAGAVETYTALINYDSGNSDAHFLRGCIYLNEGESEKALKDFKKAVSIDEKNYELYIAIAENLAALSYSDDALEMLNLGLEVEGSSKDDYLGRGRIYIVLGQYDAAVKVLNKAVDKKSNEAKLYLSQVYSMQGNIDAANSVLSDYLNGDVTSESLNALGDLYMKNGEYELALNAYRQGLEQSKITNEKMLRKNEIGALEYTGNWQDAYEKANVYITDYPTDQDVLREIVFLKTRVEGPYES